MSLTVPGEWAPHAALWLGFPSHGELWEDNLEPAQREVAGLARALAGPGAERVRLLVCGDAAAAAARSLLQDSPGGGSGIEIVRGEFGDIWLRDTGPCSTSRASRSRRPASASTAGAASTCWKATTRSPSRSPRPPARP